MAETPRRHSTRVSLDLGGARAAESKHATTDDLARSLARQLAQTSMNPAALKPVDLAETVVHIMHTVEASRKMSGPQKKAVVCKTVKMLVDQVENENNRNLLVAATNYIVPSVVDMIASAAKGQFKINLPAAVEEVDKCCWNRCL